jgi:IclR family mhp operon transcriptional activator
LHPSVRALSRGLLLLTELNAGGPASALQLSQRAGMNRTTAYRLLHTMVEDGYVVFDEPSGLFSQAAKVINLSDGMTARDAMSQAALPAMFDLMKEVSWPSDIAVFDAGSVVIRESTHQFSPFSVHRAMVGRRRPFLRSSLGRAILAAARPRLRRTMLEITAASGNSESELARDDVAIAGMLRQYKRDGFAWSIGDTEKKISAIALPIISASEVIGSMNIIFFSTTMTPQRAADRYLQNLRSAVASVETELRRWVRR